MKVLVIDNYDSFVFNLVHYVGEQGADPIVYRNDEITLEKAKQLKPDRIIISPGPGSPEDPHYFGVCTSILKEMSSEIKTLGVCLGFEGIVCVFGGKLGRIKEVKHGKTSLIEHDGKGIFRGVRNPFEGTRYHSLVGKIETIPDCLKITAMSMDDKQVMGVRHKRYPIEGVLFHPESILTQDGKLMIKNFLEDD